MVLFFKSGKKIGYKLVKWSGHFSQLLWADTKLPVCTDDLYYKREADWVGHEIMSHPWRDQELTTPIGPEAHMAVYWGQD